MLALGDGKAWDVREAIYIVVRVLTVGLSCRQTYRPPQLICAAALSEARTGREGYFARVLRVALCVCCQDHRQFPHTALLRLARWEILLILR